MVVEMDLVIATSAVVQATGRSSGYVVTTDGIVLFVEIVTTGENGIAATVVSVFTVFLCCVRDAEGAARLLN